MQIPSAGPLMSTNAKTTWKYLERDPKSSYQQLSIRGRRIRARTLYGCFMSEEEPRTIEEIAQDFELPVEAVQEAIVYCASDPPEIREDLAREDALMEAMGMNGTNGTEHRVPRTLTPQEMAQIARG
jgi:uncharacterized protein (DUF433 family)